VTSGWSVFRFVRVALSIGFFAAWSNACALCGVIGWQGECRWAAGDQTHSRDDGHLHDVLIGADAGSGVFGGTASGQGGMTITYSYNNILDGGLRQPDGTPLPPSLIRASIEEALGLWANVVPIQFVEVPDEGGPVVVGNYPDGQYGDIRFHHLYINGPDVPGQPPTTKAQAYYPNSGNHSRDVYYDNGDPWQESGLLAIPDVLGATIHELGHTLGLTHSNNPDANMYWIFTRYPGLGHGRLHPEDIARVQVIYGAGIGSVTPLPSAVPEPGSWSLLVSLLAAIGGCGLSRRRHNLG
jgi:hypothetical protein